jgi:hypothetical protein
MSAAAFAASAGGIYSIEKKARSVSRCLILRQGRLAMKRIAKSDRVKETVQKRAHIPGSSRGPFRREALAACRPSSWCGKVRRSIRIGALLPSSVIAPRAGARPTYARICYENSPRNRCRFSIEADYQRRPKMRFLGLALAGSLALMTPIAAHSSSEVG